MIEKLREAANSFLDGYSNGDEFCDTLDNLLMTELDSQTIIWLAKAIAERDLPAKHRLIG